MSGREKFLAIFLILAIVGAASGFVGYVFVLEPLKSNNEQLAKLDDEVKDLDGKKTVLLMQQSEYENKMRKMSLPLNDQLASREYERLFGKMLRDSKLEVQKFTSKPPNNKSNVPMLPGKKPIYTMLDFDVTVSGELQNFVSFLYNFYRQPLLHEIKRMNIVKPNALRGGEAKGGRDLNYTLLIQALVLDRAENRSTLLATVPAVAGIAGGAGATSYSFRNVESGHGSPFMVPGILARESAQKEYNRIAGKNIFFDPLPKRGSAGDPDDITTTKESDVAPYVQLKGISHCNGVSKAFIYDRLRNQEYEINMTAKGEFAIFHYWFKPEKNADGLTVDMVKKSFPPKKQLEFGFEETGNLRKYAVRRIMERDLILEIPDPNREKLIKGPEALLFGGAGASLVVPSKLLVWSVGQFLTHVDPKRASAGELANANTDSRKASVELVKPKAILECLMRPLDLDNEGDGTIHAVTDGFELPTEKKTDGKKTDNKNRKKGRGG